MRIPEPQPDWPESWKLSYHYDRLELLQDQGDRGYSYAYERRHKRTLQAVRAFTPPGGSVLDVAAAQGNFSVALAELGYRVTWNDLRAELADYVRQKDRTGAITYAPGNCLELRFRDLFDTILITEIIEHVAHPDDFLAKVAGLLRPGGRVVMTTPNGGYFRNRLPRFSDCPHPSRYEAVQFRPDGDGHIFLLWADEVAGLAQAAGLAVREMQLFVNPLTRGCLGTKVLLRWLPAAVVRAVERMTSGGSGPVSRRVNLQMLAVLEKAVPPEAHG
jgi:2-polyprenyl-6-hydroxyphenyl methylase/3-demethylubiquinone-9 3-methyltransferase